LSSLSSRGSVGLGASPQYELQALRSIYWWA
jgi:hypothetical protein